MKTLGVKKNFLGLEKKYSNYPESKIVIISAPLEKTVSYGKGTACGPREILNASHYVEFYDEELERELCFEFGIATLPEIKFDKLSSKKALNKIYNEVKKNLDAGKFVVTLGGEHSISSATIRAHHEKFEGMSILQIDAHSDLRDTYENSKYSHASVMARVAEFNSAIVQVGIRAQDISETYLMKEKKIETFYARDIRQQKYGLKWQAEVLKSLSDNVYITFDVDGLDPSIIGATGTPEPGGLFWDETLDLLKLVGNEKTVVGFDVVELAPSKFDKTSNFNTAKLVYKMLNYSL